MGCCRSRNILYNAASETQNTSQYPRSSRKDSRNIVKFDEEDICQVRESERPSIGRNSISTVQCLVLNVLDVVRKLTESVEEPPLCLKRLHEIAESENGWLEMVLACIEIIPLDNDLGPAVISILLDECSLAPKNTMYLLLSILGLTPEKKNPPAEIKISSTSTVQRNIAIVLGSLAEKLAGQQSVWLMRDEVLQFLLSKLVTTNKSLKLYFPVASNSRFTKKFSFSDSERAPIGCPVFYCYPGEICKNK